MAAINITPLVHVLLVIFMVTAPVLMRGIPLDLPGRAPPLPQAGDPIHLRIDAAGRARWNGGARPRSALAALLQAEAERAGGQPPLLHSEASGEADYGVVARVPVAARNAGIDRIAFVQ